MRKALIFTFVWFGVMGAAQPVPKSSLPADAEIRKILAQRIETKQSMGIVVGVIEPQGRRVVSYGSLAKGDTRSLSGDTVFEIGSITKVFTALLLADMAARGEVALSDPIGKYLPAEVRVPQRNGQAITLETLATHTSGLPRLPSNLKPKDSSNPYADYSVDDLYHFLSGYELTRDIGSKYEYSNLGDGLLGHALARRAGTNYEALARTRICDPLGMNSTRIALPPELKARFAAGHNAALEPAANWDLPTLAGAGALRSSTNDLLTFLAAAMGYSKTPLTSALTSLLNVRHATGVPGLEISLGWHVSKRNGREIIWQNGGTGGYRSFLGFDPKERVGVVVLANAATAAGVDDIGQHLLDPQFPLREPPKQRTQIAVDPQLFARYLGRYQLTPKFIFTVTDENGHLLVQLSGQSKLEVFAESERDFFYKVVDAQITFETDGQDRATALVLHQNGLDQRATRIE